MFVCVFVCLFVCLFVCVVSFSVVGSCLGAEASLAPSPVNWLVGQLLSDVYPVGVSGPLQSVQRPRDPRDYIGEELIGPKLV